MPFTIPNLLLSTLVELTPVRESAKYFCTGIRIHTHWVLTAAHCVDQIKSIKIKPYNSNQSPVTVQANKVVIDQNYYQDCSFHDLALIQHTDTEQLIFSDFDLNKKFPENFEALRLGISLQNQKPILSKQNVRWVNNKPNYDPIAKNTFDRDGLQMILFQNDETKIGHSGGPIFSIENGKAKLLAIHSGTKGGKEGNDFAYAATLLPKMDWIRSIMKSKKIAVTKANTNTTTSNQKKCPPPPAIAEI